MLYEGFKAIFEDQLKNGSADRWAETFRRAGAKYVVMVAKYHDGFSLWPTQVRNPHKPDWFSRRDLVGELADATHKRGMKFGIYYSGGVDWTFQTKTVKTLGDYVYMDHGSDYADYADAQVRELITRYKPDILWNDISWPTGEKRLFAMFADYYNTVPDGIVNDRWQTGSLFKKAMGVKPARATFDLLMKQVIKSRPDFLDSIKPPIIPHSDLTTPEYTQYDVTQAKK
jgi:alpha-L-fucosidase